MDDLDDALATLTASAGDLERTVADLPRTPGLVAWWVAPGALSLRGSVHPVDGTTLLAVGAAASLRNRVTRQDLYRTGVSWPRRALAGLLLDDLALTPTWAGDVVLTRADEDRLDAWLRAHLRLTWWAGERRRELLDPVLAALPPALREDAEPARGALARFTTAAGAKPVRDPSVPFRRP